VETLRREGFDGRVTLVGDEDEPPYDRPPLSKDVLTGSREPDTVYLRTPQKLDELDVELVLGTRVDALDLTARTVSAGGAAIAFDGLILATGATPRRLQVLDAHPGVHTLRTLDDALRLRNAFGSARHVTVVGAGFIGSEVASSARSRGLDVTILDLETSPLAAVIGPALGRLLTDIHDENGTELRLGVTVTGVEPSGALRLNDGSSLETDLVVVGIGVVPNVDWLAGSGIAIENGVQCDMSLNAGAPGVFAVGDIANWPNALAGRRMRVEHWMNAGDQAAHAVRSLLHRSAAPYVSSNYVWSDQYGRRLQFAGRQTDESVVVDGTMDDRRMVVWYRDGDRIVGAMAIDSPKLLMRSKRMIEEERTWTDALAELNTESVR
jgi:NADPH-dependent 2,4-dienoyl-CoA reductase/sulfur reductase-like enzyme